jgi:hypothetical protein
MKWFSSLECTGVFRQDSSKSRGVNKSKNRQKELHEQKKFSTMNNHWREEATYRMEENICKLYTSTLGKWLICRIYKELNKSKSKTSKQTKLSDLIKRWAIDPKYFIKRDSQRPNRYTQMFNITNQGDTNQKHNERTGGMAQDVRLPA